MQLQMTAPMDIGMEQHDLSLHGQADIFDLEETAKGLSKKGGLSALGDEDDADSSEEETSDDEEEAMLDSEEERERKVNKLEAELDELYGAYQDRLKERDAKYKVKEARKNSADREEWGGIRKDDSDDEDGEDSEGGYDIVQNAKEKAGDDSDSAESDLEEDSGHETAPRSTKRSRIDDGESSKQRKKARTDVVNISSKGEEPLSRNAEVWFSQGLFKEAGLSDVEDDDVEEEGTDEMDVDSGVELEEEYPSQTVSSHWAASQ